MWTSQKFTYLTPAWDKTGTLGGCFMMMMMMMMIIYLTANGLLPGGSGYNACT
jgi:hypothetical protein